MRLAEKLFYALDGVKVSDKVDSYCDVPLFALSSGGGNLISAVYDVITCDASFFIAADVNSNPGYLLQVSAAELRSQAGAAVAATDHRSTYPSTTTVGLGCLSNRLVVAMDTKVLLFDIPTATTLSLRDSITYPGGETGVLPSRVATFASTVFWIDTRSSALKVMGFALVRASAPLLSVCGMRSLCLGGSCIPFLCWRPNHRRQRSRLRAPT